MNPQRQKELIQKFQALDSELVRRVLEELLQSDRGKTFLWWLLDKTECYSETNPENALALAKASGRREIAHVIREALQSVDPASYGALLSWGAMRAAERKREIENV